MGSDLVKGPALAQPRENAPPPQHPPMRVEPARERRRPFVDHACLAWPPARRPILTERRRIAWLCEIGKRNRRIFAARGPWAAIGSWGHGRLRQRTAGDPASPVKNADDGNKIVVGNVAINHNIRRDEANSNEPAKLGAERAAFWERRHRARQSPPHRVGNKLACPRGKIANNLGGISVRRFGDDDARHYFRSAERRAALRALCSSSVMKSPRSSAARPSSTKGFAHAISSRS